MGDVLWAALEGVLGWDGASFVARWPDGFTCMVRIARTIDGVGHVIPANAELGPRDASDADFRLDLEDADTRAVYDHHLAIELGAAPDQASKLVGVWIDTSGGSPVLIVVAGACGPTQWSTEIRVDTPDELLARAHAWPADKRHQPAEA